MKRDELVKMRELTIPELRQRARETKEELFNLRFALRTGHLSDYSKVRATRHAYAQIQTVINEKRIAEATHGAA
ncbi:MAG TPA: 50S ribosomal protein L29 [Candidatus Baltobacteraceae bacterium]|jgi:large subunit ribosomal protein L29|nr:50S ribosomal protein L29 [Candidatus Baltobacteraceae bacterium]